MKNVRFERDLQKAQADAFAAREIIIARRAELKKLEARVRSERTSFGRECAYQDWSARRSELVTLENIW